MIFLIGLKNLAENWQFFSKQFFCVGILSFDILLFSRVRHFVVSTKSTLHKVRPMSIEPFGQFEAIQLPGIRTLELCRFRFLKDEKIRIFCRNDSFAVACPSMPTYVH
jgi:hypothetical protein